MLSPTLLFYLNHSMRCVVLIVSMQKRLLTRFFASKLVSTIYLAFIQHEFGCYVTNFSYIHQYFLFVDSWKFCNLIYALHGVWWLLLVHFVWPGNALKSWPLVDVQGALIHIRFCRGGHESVTCLHWVRLWTQPSLTIWILSAFKICL